jgi:hypothetical protein
LFSNFLSDRDGAADGGVLGNAIEPLTHVFVVFDAETATQGTNKLRFDDFFLSLDGLNGTIPAPAGAFYPPLRITRVQHDPLQGLQITWTSVPGSTYVVNKRINLNEAWEQVFEGIAVEDSTTYLDTEGAFYDSGFYQIVLPQP